MRSPGPIKDPHPEAVPGIRGDGFDGALGAVERLGYELFMRHPEVTVEIALQPGRIFNQRGVTTGHTDETALQISLHLAQRGGMSHLASIVVGERIIGILPALVARAAPVVLDVTVPIRVAEGRAPLERGFGRRPKLVRKALVVRPALAFTEGTEKERRGVDGALEDVRPAGALDRLARAHVAEAPAPRLPA